MIRLPVMYAGTGDVLWVAVGRAQDKSWWRNLRSRPHVEILWHGRWYPAIADVVPSTDDSYPDALAVYTRRWPRARLGGADPLVRITTGPTALVEGAPSREAGYRP